MEVLYIANKYDMPFLAIKCREYLQECLKPEVVFIVLPQVQKMGDQELEHFCWKVIDNKTHLAISSKPFLEIPREMLCQVLTRDSLKVKELEIFQAVDKWASKKIEEGVLENTGDSKRAILGEDIIRLIRFPLMSFQEFAEVVLPCEILKRCELTELVQIIGKVASSTSMFSKKHRRGSGVEVCLKNRFSIIKSSSGSWHYKDKKVDAVNFTINKPAHLSAVKLFGSNGSTYTIELEILERDQIMSKLSSSYICEMVNDEYYGFTAKLDEPVSLEPNISYTIKAKIQGPISYYGNSGNQVVNMNDKFKITFQSSDKSKNGTNVERGQFPSLIFLC
ncbi:BTB/POZ domain-containing protein 1-like [Exaiptasia diaphana]|uniref:BACK domain-containing protein n=1 Tax=Exaiptasia diaphana TaxID=2652724 RepID=A0A913XD64_EXADI|nr:BTB/POZ domain-containing protein 1-like [Exaiptasia diaphana]